MCFYGLWWILSFFKLFFKAFLLNWFKNLRAEFGRYRKRAGFRTPWSTPPPPPRIQPLDARLFLRIFSKSKSPVMRRHQVDL